VTRRESTYASKAGFQENYKVLYRGERYPHLEREAAKSDVLSEITMLRALIT
jgi:hypothetical protein